MQTICRFTGVSLVSAASFPKLLAISHHPLFNLPLEKLVARTGSFQEFISRPLPEQSLLLVAIATKLGLLDFSGEDSCPAVPSPHIPVSCFPNLLRIAQGKIASGSAISYEWPSLRVTLDSANLETLPAMLQEIVNMPRIAAASAKLTEALDAMEQKITLLARGRSGGDIAAAAAIQRVSTRYALLITKEQQKAERLSPELLELWNRMLLSPAGEAYKYELADIEELQEFMVTHLPHGNDACYEVLQHCRALYEARANPTATLLSKRGSTITLGELLTAELVSESAANAAPKQEATPMPQQSDYPSKVAYLVALANWRAAQ